MYMLETAPSEIIESHLLGITSDPIARQAVFQFRTADGLRNFTLTARDVDELSVNEFLKQNVVHHVRILGAASDLGEINDLLAALLFDKSHAAEVTDSTFLAELENRTGNVVHGERILVEIEPVYGASVLVLAGSVTRER
jgi:hypothetical protein